MIGTISYALLHTCSHEKKQLVGWERDPLCITYKSGYNSKVFRYLTDFVFILSYPITYFA